jgi:nucleoid-associated protein YgaU
VIHRRLRPLAALLGAAAAIVALDALGTNRLAPPPLSITGTGQWLAQRDAVVAAFALVRLGALAAAWYVLVVVAGSVLARTLSLRSADAVLARLTPTHLRLWLRGAGVSSAAFLGLLGPPGTAVLHPLPVDPTTTTTTDPGANGAAIASIRPLPETAETETPAAPVPPGTAPDTWVVAPGDSFWSIATSQLTDSRGTVPGEADVVPYWLTLVERNRATLANPDDPDLLFPGQVVELPPVLAG